MFARADFKPEIFDLLIRQKGYTAIWEQGLFCPCYESLSGQPDYTCPLCRGRGYIYVSPKETKVIVTSINGNKEQERIGLNDLGVAYLTPLATDNVGFRDRFTFTDSITKFSEIIIHGSESMDRLRYKCIEMIMVRDLNTVYKLKTDFKISADGQYIEWISNMPVGSKYTVLYCTHPVYIAINPIHEIRGTYLMKNGGGKDYYMALPKQFQIKREDFVDNNALRQY